MYLQGKFLEVGLLDQKVNARSKGNAGSKRKTAYVAFSSEGLLDHYHCVTDRMCCQSSEYLPLLGGKCVALICISLITSLNIFKDLFLYLLKSLFMSFPRFPIGILVIFTAPVPSLKRNF